MSAPGRAGRVGAREESAGAARRGGAGEQAAAARALARVVFAVLVLACFGAFLLTQHLKHAPTPVQQFRLTPFFSPYRGARHELEAISFKLRHADEVTVSIIDTSGNTVASLVRDRPLARYERFSLRWNGRRGAARSYGHMRAADGVPVLVALCPGAVAPAGEYRVEVTLRHERKTLRSPNTFTLVAR